MLIVVSAFPRRGFRVFEDTPDAILLALGFTAIPDAVLIYLWFSQRHSLKFYRQIERGGGYWVYEPLNEEAVDEWISEWDGEVELDPDGKRREPKWFWKS